jgi:adenosine deaminase
MRPTTLLKLGEKYGLAPPAPGDGTFSTFLRLYAAACETLRHRDDMEQLVREVAEDAAADGAVWIEPAEWPRPGAAERLGLTSPAAVVELVIDAARKAERQTGIGIGVIVQANRLSPTSEALELARLAASLVERGVVAFGLAGDEAAGPPEPFTEAFAIARSAGLISAPHAGEHAGPDSVRGALDALGAQRIEHGIRAIEDPRLVERLTSEQVCLDVHFWNWIARRRIPDLAGART